MTKPHYSWERAPLPPNPNALRDRNAEIVAAVDAGGSAGKVAARFGVSKQRVQQIVARERRKRTEAPQ